MKKITMEETRRIDVLKILNSLFQKYKNESWVLTGEQIRKKINSYFPGKWGLLKKHFYFNRRIKYGLSSGVIYINNNLEILNKIGCGGPYYLSEGCSVLKDKDWDSFRVLGIEILYKKIIKVRPTGWILFNNHYKEKYLTLELKI